MRFTFVSGKRHAGEGKVSTGRRTNNGLATSDPQIWTQASANVPGSPKRNDNFGAALY